MQIQKLVLKGYRRFALNGYDRIELDFTAALQLILGTNGCGKSSLLEQLTPLPPNPADFSKDGHKTIEIAHNGKSYKMHFVFAPKRHFSFEVDGIELNEGGTGMVHTELVREHFGTTPDIHQLVLGKELFTGMSPARRKEWFLRLSDVNYEYAIRVFNKAKEMLRDASGATKLTKRTLLMESERLVGDETIVALKKEADQFHAILHELMEIRKPVEHDVDMLEVDQQQIDTQVFRLAKAISDIYEQLKDSPYTEEDYEQTIARAKEMMVASNAILSKAAEEHSAIAAKVEILRKAEAKSIDALQAECDELRSRSSKLLSSCAYQEALPNATQLSSLYETIRDSLVDVFADLPPNVDGRFSSDALTEAKAKLAEQERTRSNLAEEVNRMSANLRHLEGHKDAQDVECPQCSHRFSARYDPKKVEQLTKAIGAVNKRIEQELTPSIAQLTTFVSECTLYGQTWRRYVGITNNARQLQPYWTMLEDAGVKADPRVAVAWLQRISNELQTRSEVEYIDKIYVEKNALLKSMRLVGSDDLQTLTTRMNELSEQVSKSTADLKFHTEQQDIAKTELARLKQFNASRRQLSELLRRKMDLVKEAREQTRRQIVNDLIRSLQSELAKREQQIGSAAQQKAIVDNLAKQVDALTTREQALSTVVRELSPTEGLIAEGLMGFMNGFVEQMNAIIRSVWSYPLVIQTCEFSDSATIDLDYKFPMKVPGNNDPVSDVSKGSAGMIEIIDLAYKITAMRCLNMTNAPLILDELGAAMDPQHKAETVHIIRALVDQRIFPQVFFISHDFAQYGALEGCEITLLNNLNVTAPPGSSVNKHVKFN